GAGLVTGCAWVDVERLLGNRVSDTTLRDRRDEWIAAGVFDRLADEAVAGYDRIVGLDFSGSMAASTKRPSVGRAPAPARLTEANAAGSGRCSRIVTASPSDGQPRVPTATTACCWNRPSPRSPTGG